VWRRSRRAGLNHRGMREDSPCEGRRSSHSLQLTSHSTGSGRRRGRSIRCVTAVHSNSCRWCPGRETCEYPAARNSVVNVARTVIADSRGGSRMQPNRTTRSDGGKEVKACISLTPLCCPRKTGAALAQARWCGNSRQPLYIRVYQSSGLRDNVREYSVTQVAR